MLGAYTPMGYSDAMALRNVLSLMLPLLVVCAAGAACACGTSHETRETREMHELPGSTGVHAAHGVAEHAGHADGDCHHEFSPHVCPHGCAAASPVPEAQASVVQRQRQAEADGEETEPVRPLALVTAAPDLAWGPRPPERRLRVVTPVSRSDQLNE